MSSLRTQKGMIRLFAGITVVVLVLGTVASLGGLFSGTSSTGFPPYAIRWNFPYEVKVCGSDYAFTEQVQEADIIHGLNDRYIHITGVVTDSADVTLGKFFESVGLDFGNDHIAEYKSGETVCPSATTPGTLKVTANGTVLDDPVGYVFDKEHQDIVVTFE